MRPIPSDRVNASAFPELMKRLGILHEPETEFEKRAAAYAVKSSRRPLVTAPIPGGWSEYWRKRPQLLSDDATL